ncbi:phosphoribosyltransferase [Actinokineospora globicatena]|uniref:phosphoribosyltransferase n=1 Tax=Actinokineospora globicatena TaxID=103729 RepID=UPI0020A325E4|nr:phosphoribosyltransferase [Actinokineospora globicatena]MCP2300490.1 putative amidophosphoribosyltransferases [Actinokineospora globicatena]GLW81025.1 hypothetical protein Aglo01_55060 [Actinokineospora globicatena]GLW88218.1 hypothetical protein Aglo02_58570 [Actinokineospora globicatena]
MRRDDVASNPARIAVQERVGSVFRNAQWLPGRTCKVCATPTSGYERCFTCQQNHLRWNGDIADATAILAYAYRRSGAQISLIGRHQSEQHMWSYKNPQPGPGCTTDLGLMLFVAAMWHRRCAEAQTGLPWQAWTTVPSAKHSRLGEHPLVRLCRNAYFGNAAGINVPRADLVLAQDSADVREVRQGLFGVSEPSQVRGKHVLLVEDTWVTGGSAQSAALALKDSGATAVTILCLARWLREDGPADARAFYTDLTEPYDPAICPVADGMCQMGPTTRA